MLLGWEPFVSLRLLSRKRGSAFLSPAVLTAVLGILFSMATALICLSVVSGFEEAYKKSILDFNAHLVFMGEGDREDTDKMLSVLDAYRVKGVVAATPFIFREGLGVLPGGIAPLVLKGVNPQVAGSLYPMKYVDAYGRPQALERLLVDGTDVIPTVILGKQLYKKFFPGDLQPAPAGGRLVRLLVPRKKEATVQDYELTARVAGTFESGLYEFDARFVLVAGKALARVLDLGSRKTGVEVVLDDPGKAPALARLIEQGMPEGIQGIAWTELNESLFSAMKMEKTLFFVIMLLVLLVASFNVMGVVLMLLLERTQDAAILRALGASSKRLATSFALCGLYLGAIAGLAGGGLAFIILWLTRHFHWLKLDPQVYFVSELPVAWPFGLWLILFLALLGICFTVSLIASRLVNKVGLVRVFR